MAAAGTASGTTLCGYCAATLAAVVDGGSRSWSYTSLGSSCPGVAWELTTSVWQAPCSMHVSLGLNLTLTLTLIVSCTHL